MKYFTYLLTAFAYMFFITCAVGLYTYDNKPAMIFCLTTLITMFIGDTIDKMNNDVISKYRTLLKKLKERDKVNDDLIKLQNDVVVLQNKIIKTLKPTNVK